MKHFKTIILSSIIVLTIVLLTACGNQSSIIGSWEHSGYTYTFNDDKTGSYSTGGTEMRFTYENNGKEVSILYTGNTTPSSYEYKIEGNKLIIKDSFGSDIEYTKK